VYEPREAESVGDRLLEMGKGKHVGPAALSMSLDRKTPSCGGHRSAQALDQLSRGSHPVPVHRRVPGHGHGPPGDGEEAVSG